MLLAFHKAAHTVIHERPMRVRRPPTERKNRMSDDFAPTPHRSSFAELREQLAAAAREEVTSSGLAEAAKRIAEATKTVTRARAAVARATEAATEASAALAVARAERAAIVAQLIETGIDAELVAEAADVERPRLAEIVRVHRAGGTQS